MAQAPARVHRSEYVIQGNFSRLRKRKSAKNSATDDGAADTHTLNRLQEVSGVLEASVGAVVRLRGESHGGTVAATGASLLVIGTAGVPGKTNEDLQTARESVAAS